MTVGTCAVTLDPGPASPCVMTGSSNPPTLVGTPLDAFVIDVKISSDGALGVCEYSWRLNGGAWSTPAATRDPNVIYQGAPISLGTVGRENAVGDGLGVKARFVDTTYTAGQEWSYTLATQPGAPTVTGSDVALGVGTALVGDEFTRLIEDRSGCPLPDPDDDNSSSIASWLAFAQRRFDAMATRAVGLATVFDAYGGGGGGGGSETDPLAIHKDGSSTVSADIPMNSHKLTGLAPGSGANDAATIAQLAAVEAEIPPPGITSESDPLAIHKDGSSTVSADIPMNSHKLTGLAPGVASTDAATVGQLAALTESDPYAIHKDGSSTVSADIPLNSHKLTGLAAATAAGDAVRFEQLPATPYTALDANTLLCWRINETSSPFASTGSNSQTLSTKTGTPVFSTPGLFDTAVDHNASAILWTGNSTVEPTSNSLTLSCWLFLFSQTGSFGGIVTKEYRNDGTHNSPYTSLGLQWLSTADGTWTGQLVISGTLRGATSNNVRVPLYRPTLLAMTYDGTTIKSYQNGILVGTGSYSGSVDWGTHGPWLVNGYQTGGALTSGIIEDVRVESTVRSASYLRAMYLAGMRWAA